MSQSVSVIEPTELDLDAPDLMLVQVTSVEVFQQARIPGAVLVTPQELVCGVPPASGRLPEPDQVLALFQRIGYTPDADIVVYDDEGGGWAGRFAWTLDIIGHTSWRYLNGGLHSWHAAGLPLEQGGASPPEANAGLSLELDTSPIAEVEDVLSAIEDEGQIIWDVRSDDEYMGRRSGSARAGHIPGAVNSDWLTLKDAAQRISADLQATLANLGLKPGVKIITHCQTHHRSGLSYMLGRLNGLDIRAYHGSWSEWGNRDDTPIDNPSA